MVASGFFNEVPARDAAASRLDQTATSDRPGSVSAGQGYPLVFGEYYGDPLNACLSLPHGLTADEP
jgi:hypothetical protein